MNFIICTDHTVAELTVVDGQGYPGCPFCKIEELQQLVKDAGDVVEGVVNHFYRDAHPVDQRRLDSAIEEMNSIKSRSQR